MRFFILILCCFSFANAHADITNPPPHGDFDVTRLCPEADQGKALDYVVKSCSWMLTPTSPQTDCLDQVSTDLTFILDSYHNPEESIFNVMTNGSLFSFVLINAGVIQVDPNQNYPGNPHANTLSGLFGTGDQGTSESYSTDSGLYGHQDLVEPIGEQGQMVKIQNFLNMTLNDDQTIDLEIQQTDNYGYQHFWLHLVKK